MEETKPKTTIIIEDARGLNHSIEMYEDYNLGEVLDALTGLLILLGYRFDGELRIVQDNTGDASNED